MARYIKDFQINVDPQIIHSSVNQYLQSEGYDYINYDGENVYKKGTGAFTNPTFFKFSYAGNMVRMETWMKYAFFPGVFVGELGTTGFVGSAVKGPWKNRIKNIESMLTNFAMQNTSYNSAPVQNTATSFETNETQLFNANDSFEETGLLNDTPAAPIGGNSVFCTGCGAQLSEGTIFCTVCGQKRVDANPQPVVTAQAPQPQPLQQFNQQGFPQPGAFNFGNETPLPPPGCSVSRKEFIEKYAQPSLRKNIKNIAILCYVCAGVTFAVACALNPYGIIDAVILAAFALGMHLAKNRVCAYLILVLSIIEVILSLTMGSFPFWWLVAGVSAVVTFNNIEKQYKEFLKFQQGQCGSPLQ